MIHERQGVAVREARRRLGGELPGAFLQAVWRLPIVEGERRLRRKVERKLAAFWTEPKSILPAVVVELGLGLAVFDEFPIDEAEALSARFQLARHDARLIGAGHGDFAAARRAQNLELTMLRKKREIRIERGTDQRLHRRRDARAGARRTRYGD